MSNGAAQEHGLNKVVDQMCAMDGVVCEKLADGRIALQFTYNGAIGEVFLVVSDNDYRFQKIQFSRLRDTLTELGVTEGQTFVAPALPKRPMTPPMRAARARKKEEFEAWQGLCRTIRMAEKSLDVEYEIAQMRDYY
jgi:hypothetical protein